ncbi:MAG: RNA-guided pseudouridylation complex pseudouridine synthase subunit Cbf5 [Thermoplasmatota archaeon]
MPPTDPSSGVAPAARTIEDHLRLGVVNLDKPAGPTSHQVVAWLKLALQLEKAGHGGTLDPSVTGVLPVALSDATRMVKTLLLAPKEYMVEFEANREVSGSTLRDEISKFRGPIWQMPPLESAVKRELRVRTIYELEVLEIEKRRALFRVRCEAGTYMRKLCDDLGTMLLVGGHMAALRRLRTGPFGEASCVTLHDLRDAYETWRTDGDERALRLVVRPVEELVAHLPRIELRDAAVDAVCHGAPLGAPGIASCDERTQEGELAALFTLKGELVAVGEARLPAKRMVEDNHGVAVQTTRVLMRPGTYRRGWK